MTSIYSRAYSIGAHALLIGLLTAGCASPAAPSASLVDPRAVAVVAVLDGITTPLPWNGLTMRQWRERLNVTIRVEPLPQDYGAVWNGSSVVLNANLTGYDLHGQAGLIAHELRHADGIAHDCGPHQDHRATPWSAYAVHVWTLRQLGEEAQALGNEGGYCD